MKPVLRRVTPQLILDELGKAGVEVSTDGQRLHLSGPKKHIMAWKHLILANEARLIALVERTRASREATQARVRADEARQLAEQGINEELALRALQADLVAQATPPKKRKKAALKDRGD